MAIGIVILWAICAMGGWAIGNSKGRATQGFVLGLLLSVIGLIIIAGMSPRDPAAITPKSQQRMFGESERAFEARLEAEKAPTQPSEES